MNLNHRFNAQFKAEEPCEGESGKLTLNDQHNKDGKQRKLSTDGEQDSVRQVINYLEV